MTSLFARRGKVDGELLGRREDQFQLSFPTGDDAGDHAGPSRSSSTSASDSSLDDEAEASSPPSKGHGLKRWRRRARKDPGLAQLSGGFAVGGRLELEKVHSNAGFARWERGVNNTGMKHHNYKSLGFRPLSGVDPFVESIFMLQMAQEALETEIQKIGEIRKATESDDLDNLSEDTEVRSSRDLDAHLLVLNQKIEHLQKKLEETSATVKVKELKVLELDAIIKRSNSSHADDRTTEDTNGLNNELEEMLENKMQAEIEYLVISRSALSWKARAEDQIALLHEHKTLAEDRAWMACKLRAVEEKALKIKNQAEELELHNQELLRTEKALKLQNKVCKLAFIFLVQLLLLLCVAFCLNQKTLSDETVPT